MNEEVKSQDAGSETPARYDAPAIEQIVTPEDIEREVHYAGQPAQSLT
jgi:hypothetical protein